LDRRLKLADGVMLTSDEIPLDAVVRSVAHPGTGATVLFLGTVRDIGEEGRVRSITYEAYVPLAEKSLAEIRRAALRRWPVKKVSIVHRFGRLRLQDVSVAIAVSSAHRAEAFEACRFAIEKIKEAVPIWKRETLATGKGVWVKGKEIVEASSGTRR